jgi:hypothetical protein
VAWSLANAWLGDLPTLGCEPCQRLVVSLANAWLGALPTYGLETCQRLAVSLANAWLGDLPTLGCEPCQRLVVSLANAWFGASPTPFAYLIVWLGALPTLDCEPCQPRLPLIVWLALPRLPCLRYQQPSFITDISPSVRNFRVEISPSVRKQPLVKSLKRKMRGLVMGGRDESERRRAESQWIVAARPLCHLQYPVAYLSRLQRILPVA